MLASKEVSFIYIAIFGSFLALYWLLRMVQDVGIRRRPAGGASWEAPRPQAAIGHALLLIVTGLFDPDHRFSQEEGEGADGGHETFVDALEEQPVHVQPRPSAAEAAVHRS